MEKYYVLHNPVGRGAEFKDKISLVSVINEELSLISTKFNKKNINFNEGKLTLVDTPLADYTPIEEVKKEKFKQLSDYL